MFLCELIVMCHFILWSKLTYVFQTHIFIHFATSSTYFAIISISTALPIVCGCFKLLVDILGYLAAFLCLLVSWRNSAEYNLVLESAGRTAIINFGQLSTSTKHIFIKRIIKLWFLELWKSLQAPISPIIHLVSSAASWNNLRTENDSSVKYWLGH